LSVKLNFGINLAVTHDFIVDAITEILALFDSRRKASHWLITGQKE